MKPGTSDMPSNNRLLEPGRELAPPGTRAPQEKCARFYAARSLLGLIAALVHVGRRGRNRVTRYLHVGAQSAAAR